MLFFFFFYWEPEIWQKILLETKWGRRQKREGGRWECRRGGGKESGLVGVTKRSGVFSMPVSHNHGPRLVPLRLRQPGSRANVYLNLPPSQQRVQVKGWNVWQGRHNRDSKGGGAESASSVLFVQHTVLGLDNWIGTVQCICPQLTGTPLPWPAREVTQQI